MTQAQATIITLPMSTLNESEKMRIEKLFPRKTIKTVSIIQLVCGAIAAISQLALIAATDRCYYNMSCVGTGIWTGLMFGISGGIGLVAAHRPNYCSVTAFMVLSIISSILAIPLIVFSGL